MFCFSRPGLSVEFVAMQNRRLHPRPVKLESAFSQGPQMIHMHSKFEKHSSGLNITGLYILVEAGSCHYGSLGVWARYLLLSLDVPPDSASHIMLTSMPACFPS